MNLLTRLRSGLGLRRAPRSRSLVQMANAQDRIARALTIIVLREYHIDLDSPPPTRADEKREVFEPMYPNNEREAVREEVERLRHLEAEGPDNTAEAVERKDSLRLRVGAKSDPDELTAEEAQFLSELDADGHDGEGAD